ncbi:hypothetical protein [Streptomyces sp. 135]|uniref:oxidoreductase n=1 Tax=Streptomyces sp. 135 TaxID=2838850 RepID=UPI00320B1D1C
MHLGHNYFASSFLSPRINKPRDAYGGSLDNRAKVARAAVRAVGDRIAILAKFNMDDGAGGGLWLDEALRVARWIEADGTVDALELTVGSSLLNPMYLFKGRAPVRDFAAALPQPQRLGVQLLGHRFLRGYPYRDAFLSPWPVRCCAHRTSSTVYGRRARPARCACAATSAYRPTSRGLVAFLRDRRRTGRRSRQSGHEHRPPWARRRRRLSFPPQLNFREPL